MTAHRIEWGRVLARAVEIVRSYSTGVTLRQLFYRLVAEQLIPNDINAYKKLSARTAELRRAGTFPDLIDRNRSIWRLACWDSPEDAMRALAVQFRLDRTAGQKHALYLGVEKAGLVNQLQSWFADLGIPILALGGYSSQTYVDEVTGDVYHDGRDAVLLYAGDFDPSGEDIDRDFVERCDCFDDVIRVALSAQQVTEYNLPPAMGKATDSRAGAFIERHGTLVQVELDAVPPDVLRDLFQAAIDRYWDTSLYEDVLAQESDDIDRLWAAARREEDTSPDTEEEP